MNETITTWVLIRDSVVFDGAFDTLTEAEAAQRRNHQNYLGHWNIKSMTDKQFKKYMGGNVGKQLESVELARAVRNLTA
jgi:hypothetical protein